MSVISYNFKAGMSGFGGEFKTVPDNIFPKNPNEAPPYIVPGSVPNARPAEPGAKRPITVSVKPSVKPVKKKPSAVATPSVTIDEKVDAPSGKIQVIALIIGVASLGLTLYMFGKSRKSSNKGAENGND